MTDDEVSRRLRAVLVDPRALVEALHLLDGARWTRLGVVVRCPWEPETHASCAVERVPGSAIAVHCPRCGVRGDALTLIARVRGGAPDSAELLLEASRIAGVALADLPQAPSADAVEDELVAAPSEDEMRFDVFVCTLLALCPVESDPQVYRYLRSRGLLDLAREAGWGALPPRGPAQARVIAALVDELGLGAFEASGLAFEGRFTWERHRVLIPFRTPTVDGLFVTVQRRLMGDWTTPTYVFPTQRPPLWPYVHPQNGPKHAGRAVAFVDGAPDALALRALAARDGVELDVFGLPLKRWRETWAALARGRIVYVAMDDEDRAAVVRDGVQRAGAVLVRRWRPKDGKSWTATWLARIGEAAP